MLRVVLGWSWMHKCRCRDMSAGHEHGWASRCDVVACTANQVTTLESYLKSACQLRLPQRTVCNAPHRARHPQSGCPVTPLDIANSQAATQRSAQFTTSTGCPPTAGRRQQDAGVRMPAAQHRRRGAGVHRLAAQCATPALPQPALPLPALPQPALPQPALPQPALPQPALPLPVLPQPAIFASTWTWRDTPQHPPSVRHPRNPPPVAIDKTRAPMSSQDLPHRCPKYVSGQVCRSPTSASRAQYQTCGGRTSMQSLLARLP